MGRAILSVVVGYVVMAIIVACTFGVLMAILGADGTYKPGTYWTTNTFNAIVLAGGTVGAVIGGFICMLIVKSQRPVHVLAGLVLLIGLASAVMNMGKPDPTPPAGVPTFEEGSSRGKEPVWFSFTIAIAGPVGLLIGGRLRRSMSRDTVDAATVPSN